MAEKYNLKKMLSEIEEDESIQADLKDVKVSQDEIGRILSQKRKDKKR